jgi:hypothetical protein
LANLIKAYCPVTPAPYKLAAKVFKDYPDSFKFLFNVDKFNFPVSTFTAFSS